MNCGQAEELWDQRRDGALAGAQAEAFDAHVRDCASCGARWAEESACLALLGEAAGEMGTGGAGLDDAAFVEAVLGRHERERGRSAVLGRIRRALAIAAGVMVLGSIAYVALRSPESSHQEFAAAEIDPVGVLVREVTQQIDPHPQTLWAALTQTAWDFERLFRPERPVQPTSTYQGSI